MNSQDEKTKITPIEAAAAKGGGGGADRDCLVVIYTKEPALLGKRFVLDPQIATRIGRGSENEIELEGDAVSRRHAQIELHGGAWYAVDNRSTNGTYVNDEMIERPHRLSNGDRVKIGPTIFKYLSGEDVEAQYHEEIYRMTIIDGLTGAHVKRYLLESLDKEITRARRYERPLSVLMMDIDFFKTRINDAHGHLAGDYVLKEFARLVLSRIRRDEVFARYGGEEFTLVLPETDAEGARVLAEELRHRVEQHPFRFQHEPIHVTVSIGLACLNEQVRNAAELIQAADELLYAAKTSGRNRVVS